MAPAIVKPLMQALPVTAFTPRLYVDRYLVLNAVPVHDDVILPGWGSAGQV
jgi:hypothetical protein